GVLGDRMVYGVVPFALIELVVGSYLVALRGAGSPGRRVFGLVGLRAYVSDPSLGLAPGTQLLIGLARAAHPTGINHAATVVLGLPQLPAMQASLAGVPSTSAIPSIPANLPDVAGNGIGAQAVFLA